MTSQQAACSKIYCFFSLPYLLSYFLQTLYGMADLFIIGQFDNVAGTTAVSIDSQVMHMLTVMIVSIGQAIGGKDRRRAAACIGNTVTLFMAVSVAITLILILLVSPITHAMSTPEQAVGGTKDYLTICFIGIPFVTAYNVISAIFRGMGDSKSPMYFIPVACAANIGLNYLFMGAFHMGAAGAALETTLSQAISVAVSLFVIIKRKIGVPMTKADFKPQSAVMKKILGIGVPIAFQDGLIQVSFIVIIIIANNRGLNDSAAVGIVEKIMSFLFLIPSSMLSTVSALGAQNIGAGKIDRAVKTLRYAVMISVGFGIIAAGIMQFAAELTVSLFTDISKPDGADVIRLGGEYLRGYVWDCVFAGVYFCFSGYFCAVGKSVISFLHNIIAIVIARIPGAFPTSAMFPDTLFPMGFAAALGSIVLRLYRIIIFVQLRRYFFVRLAKNGEGILYVFRGMFGQYDGKGSSNVNQRTLCVLLKRR